MHKSTVSLALSGKGNIAEATRSRVMAKAAELGYQPNPIAQRLAVGLRNPAICIVSGALDVGLGTQKILAIQAKLTQQSFDVPIYTLSGGWVPSDATSGPDTAATQMRQICRQRPRAIVCAAQMLGAAALAELRAYLDGGGIVVTYDLPVSLPCDQVVFDREDNAYQAARHLLERGHRKIGIAMSGTAPWQTDSAPNPHSERLRGFLRALHEFNVPAREEWFFRNELYERGGAEMAARFLTLGDQPTGLCIVNDYVALAFMAEIMRQGIRVPADISIVGHDDQPIARYCPVPMTSVSQPAQEIASAVVSLLTERLNGSQTEPQTVTVQGTLAIRESVTAPRR